MNATFHIAFYPHLVVSRLCQKVDKITILDSDFVIGYINVGINTSSWFGTLVLPPLKTFSHRADR